jgi:hypothetical protein
MREKKLETKSKGGMYMKDTKFIIVQDENVANQLVMNGFQMVSSANGIYTFMNSIPQHFNFENIDIKKLVYTDRLTF